MERNAVSVSEPEIERVSRFQSLQTGQYWRALQDIPSQGIEADTVLLIQSIRWVDDVPHTIILRAHPSKIGLSTYLTYTDTDGKERKDYFEFKEHRFLLKEFLEIFEYEPNHQQVRTTEVQQLQARINGLQSELIEAQTNPNLLAKVVADELGQLEAAAKAKRDAETQQALPSPSPSPEVQNEVANTLPALPGQDLVAMATGTVANAIGAGITEAGIAALKEAAGREHQIATIKSKWIQEKTGKIAATIKAMTPYYEEQAAAALAQVEDVRTYVAKLVQGIESLDLYIGKGVTVETIREGEPAAKDVPLTFVQKKLMVDEELAVYTDLDEWFDFSKDHLFFEALQKHDRLVEQIFPSERCVLVMATTRRYIDYGDKFTNMVRNAENANVFLLVRNGMNIHRVYSPVESHLGSARLFPSKNEQAAIFKGYDGTTIKFEDVAYTDKLAKHEQHALHYKRFLLLACGLDHRLKLFGDFYDGPPTFEFVSMAFQDAHCRFLHDDDGEGLLPSNEQPAPLGDWIKEKNAYLRSGSRVLCNWRSIMNPHTAPGACKRHGDGFDRDYDPANNMDIMIAFREGTSTCVEIEVGSRWRERKFNCKVNISKYQPRYWDGAELAFLCLDTVRPDELRWYIANRKTRGDHLFYIRFFKTALKFIEQERRDEQATRQHLAQALADGQIATGDEASEIIDQAVVAWRAANRGKPLPAFLLDGTAPVAWKSLLDQMFMLAGEGRRQADEVEAFLAGLGYAPLRLVLSGGAKLVVYAAPKDAERDNRLTPHVWVHRISLERGKTKISEKSRRWVMLPQAAASETTLHQWPGADEWIYQPSVFQTFERKQEIFGIVGMAKDLLLQFAAPMSAETYSKHHFDWDLLREQLLENATKVINPVMAIPFGLVYFYKSNELRFLCVGSRTPHALLYALAPNEEAQRRLRAEFVKPYQDKEYARKSFDQALNGDEKWTLMEATISLSQSKVDVFIHEAHGVVTGRMDCKAAADPLLATWFDRWQKDNAKHAHIWVNDALRAEDGQLAVDDMLGIKRPEAYDPKRLWSVTLCPGSADERPVHGRWFDIGPDLSDEEKPKRSFWGESDLKAYGLVPASVSGYSCNYSTCISMDGARERIQQAIRQDHPGMTAVLATSIPGAPLPPEGYERWYVIPKLIEGEA